MYLILRYLNSLNNFFSFGSTSHYVMRECFASYSKAFAVPKSSIYKPTLDVTMLRIVQSGLARKYINEELEKVSKANSATSLRVSDKRPLSLKLLQVPFWQFLVFQGACILIFLAGMVTY